jgi:hypothetical protein
MALLRTTTEHPVPVRSHARQVTLSLVTMAVITGGLLRIYRTIVLEYGWSDRWGWIAGTFIAGAAFLFIMATLHLGNYPVRSWTWRAPTFAVVEALTEIAVSLAFTVMGIERIGSLPATMEDWQSTSVRILFFRLVAIPLFALVLAGVSTLVRILLLPRRPLEP